MNASPFLSGESNRPVEMVSALLAVFAVYSGELELARRRIQKMEARYRVVISLQSGSAKPTRLAH
jgi:hypothetical protein